MSPIERYILPVGNTIRMEGGEESGTEFVLLVGRSLMSQWWLYILTLSHRPAMRQYMLCDDLSTVLPRLHVQPQVLPAFLVCRDGWSGIDFFCGIDPRGRVVDWFPAPLPASEEVLDPLALLALVEARLAAYGR